MFDEAEALSALRATLPWWVGLAPLAFVIVAAACSALASFLAVSIALRAYTRLAPGAHWTERARLAWPARVIASAGPMIAAVMFGALAAVGAGPLSLLSPGATGLVVGIAAFLAAYPQIGRVERRVRGRARSLRERLVGQAFALVALYPHVLIVLVAGAMMPGDARGAVIGGAIVIAALVAVALGVGLRAAVGLGLAYPADARLLAIVDAQSAKVGVRAHRVWVIRWPVVNAFAFTRTGDLAFTEEAVAELSDAELGAITAHELGHLGEPRSVVLARSLGLLALFPIAMIRPAARLGGGDDVLTGLLAALGLLLVVLVLGRVLQRIARRMEERADAVAHEHEDDPGTYARALEHIYELNLVPAVTGAKRPVHPHLYDRLVSAGVTPSYARPQPPPRAAHRLALLAMMAIASASAMGWQIGLMLAGTGNEPSLVIVALRGGAGNDLADLGRARWEAGDLEGALPYYRMLAATSTRWPHWPSELSRIYAWLGRCEEANLAFVEAERRARAEPELEVDLVPAWSSVSICMPAPTSD